MTFSYYADDDKFIGAEKIRRESPFAKQGFLSKQNYSTHSDDGAKGSFLYFKMISFYQCTCYTYVYYTYVVYLCLFLFCYFVTTYCYIFFSVFDTSCICVYVSDQYLVLFFYFIFTNQPYCFTCVFIVTVSMSSFLINM